MLYELFSWIGNNEETADLHLEIITPLSFDSEYKLGLKHRKHLLVDYRSAKFGSCLPGVVSDALQRVTQHDAYMDFMAMCQQEINAHGEIGSFFLALKYLLPLLEQKEFFDSTAAKINKIVLLWLKEDKEKALGFYTQNEKVLKEIQPITLAVELAIATDQAVEYLAELTAQLSTEEHAITLAPLFFPLIQDTEKFAGAILWLSQRVSAEHILQTDLLQKFMAYHVVFLDSDDSPIKLLYRLLSQFSEAEALVKAAGHVPCVGMGIAETSITGMRSTPDKLSPVEIMPPSLVLTPTKENFNALYRMFGINFLKLALEGYAKYQSEKWHHILFGFLNRDIEHLPVFINFIAMNAPTNLEVLASLMSEATIENLITQQSGAVWHFLPYRPALLTQLSSSNTALYLEGVRSQDATTFELLLQLTTLFSALCGANKAAAILVYESILDIVLEHVELLEDRGLVKLLKRFSVKEKIIGERSQQLQAQFDQCFEQVTYGPLSIDDYHIIEDVWYSVSRQLQALNGLVSIAYHCPRNKYELQIHIAKACLLKHPDYFNLDDFFQALEIPQVFSVEGVNQYEKLLVGILTISESAAIRTSIIQRLDTGEDSLQRWMYEEYDGETVLRKAVKQDNVDLVEWLDSNMCLSEATLCSEVAVAAKEKKWNVVRYFCESCSLPQTIYQTVLVFAAEEGQLNIVQYLCNFSITDLQRTHILQAFFCAATNGHVDVMKFLWDLNPKAVGVQMIANALKIVAQHEHLLSITFLGNLIKNSLLQRAAESALIHAVAHQQTHVIQQICTLINAPRMEVIEKASLRAFKSGNLPLARCLYGFPNVVLQTDDRASPDGKSRVRKSVSSSDLTQCGFFNAENIKRRRHSSSDSPWPVSPGVVRQ